MFSERLTSSGLREEEEKEADVSFMYSYQPFGALHCAHLYLTTLMLLKTIWCK